MEGTRLDVRASRFNGNDNGLYASDGKVVIRGSEFRNNQRKGVNVDSNLEFVNSLSVGNGTTALQVGPPR